MLLRKLSQSESPWVSDEAEWVEAVAPEHSGVGVAVAEMIGPVTVVFHWLGPGTALTACALGRSVGVEPVREGVVLVEAWCRSEGAMPWDAATGLDWLASALLRWGV